MSEISSNGPEIIGEEKSEAEILERADEIVTKVMERKIKDMTDPGYDKLVEHGIMLREENPEDYQQYRLFHTLVRSTIDESRMKIKALDYDNPKHNIAQFLERVAKEENI